MIIIHKHDSLSTPACHILFYNLIIYISAPDSQWTASSSQCDICHVPFFRIFIYNESVSMLHTYRRTSDLSVWYVIHLFTFWRFYISEILHFGDFKHETHRQQRSAADCSVCPYIYTTHCCRHQAYRLNSFVYDRKCHLSGTFRHQCIHSNQIRQNGHTRRNIFSSVWDIDMPFSHLRFFSWADVLFCISGKLWHIQIQRY